MSLPKAQLVDPQGNMNLPGMTATGIVTATSLKGVTTGSVTNLTGSPDLDVGIVTGSSFVGDGTGHAANITGTPELNLGVTTATSFVGDAVGKAAGLTGTPNLNVGLITATSFVGFVTGDVTGNISGNVVGNITGDISGLAGGLGINGTNVWTGAGTSNLGVGVCTATLLYGDASGMVGAGSSAYIAQNVTATGAETIIDLSYGNLIYYKGDADTTVGFASTSAAEQLTFIRDTDSSYSISYSTGGFVGDGTGDSLTLASTSDFDFGTGDFTIEAWCNLDQFDNYPYIVDFRVDGDDTGTNNKIVWYFRHPGGSTGKLSFWLNGVIQIDSETFQTGQWIHAALVRSSGVTKMYINGTKEGASFTDTTDYGSGGSPLIIAQRQGFSGQAIDGVLSNLRIVKGRALYTSNFVPPSAALTNVSGTVLLCCQSDSSTTTAAVTPGTITANGNPTAAAQTISTSGNLQATITWPDRVKWNGGSAPTLLNNDVSAAFQIFRFTTFDTGLNYNAWQEMIYDAAPQGRLFTWGSNSEGSLGTNAPAPSNQSSPIQIGTDSNWSDLSKGGDYGNNLFGLKSDGTLWAWGENTRGQLGLNDQGNPTRRSSPTQISGTTWTRVASGMNCSAAVKTDGTLWMWGRNDSGSSGVLGQNNLTNYSSPVQVGTETTWGITEARFGLGSRNMSNIKTDGTLWSWGYSDYGESGQNNRTKYSSPRQVGTDTSWASISVAYMSCTAIKTDGTLWGWGRGRYGELPKNTGNNIHYSSPTQIGTDTTWSFVSQGNAFGSALKTDGTLWTWGQNGDGYLGQNDVILRSSPIQIPGTTWSTINTAGQYTMALKTDGTMWVWGKGGSGRLGLNSQTDYSSPTQIPGTWQIMGSGSFYYSSAIKS